MKIVGRAWLHRALIAVAVLGRLVLQLPWANADLEKIIADPKNWAMQAGDMYNQRYSKLTQINTGTSARCRSRGCSPPACCAGTRARRW